MNTRGRNVYCKFCGHIGKVFASGDHDIEWWADKLRYEHMDETHS